VTERARISRGAPRRARQEREAGLQREACMWGARTCGVRVHAPDCASSLCAALAFTFHVPRRPRIALARLPGDSAHALCVRVSWASRRGARARSVCGRVRARPAGLSVRDLLGDRARTSRPGECAPRARARMPGLSARDVKAHESACAAPLTLCCRANAIAVRLSRSQLCSRQHGRPDAQSDAGL
jgi:hypothetical protein